MWGHRSEKHNKGDLVDTKIRHWTTAEHKLFFKNTGNIYQNRSYILPKRKS